MAEGVFALDIGTRKVAGILLTPVVARTGRNGGPDKGGPQYRIPAAEVVEQAPGAMLDGQIHDVRRVAAVIADVKGRLEKKAGRPLASAAVAAAGRSLLTSRGRARLGLHGAAIGDPERMRVLELEAVRDATAALSLEHGKKTESFLCVGYSVTGHFLDGGKIGDLYGQRGQEAAVEVIATFLPRLVVESLNAALAEAGLSASSLTLEPIAALNAVVPASMRQLNLALVDIGAGTSDIAITQGGSVTGYGMVPLAGDEVTERLMDEFLIDFAEAERLKRSLGSLAAEGPGSSLPATAAMVPVTNVLGQRLTLDAAVVLAALSPMVDAIASEVAASIRALNARPPQAVILVGGGSLTAGIGPSLARALDLPPARVAVRDRGALPEVTGAKTFAGPQTVTPIGIALSAARRQSLEFNEVTVNGRLVKILQSAEATVGEALLAAGFSARDLLGQAGAGLSVEVNGRVVAVPGTLGRPALIRVNGRAAALNTRLKADDAVEVGAPEEGNDAAASISDVLRLLPEPAGLGETDAVVRFRVNGQPLSLPSPSPAIEKNGSPASLSDPVNDGDKLRVSPSPSAPTVRDALAKAAVPLALSAPAVSLRVNGTAIWLPAASAGDGPVSGKDNPVFGKDGPIPGLILVNGRPAAPDARLADGDEILVSPPKGNRFILSDLFGHPALAEFAGRAVGAGARDGDAFIIEVNGKPAGFTTPLNDGDEVTLSWQAR